MCGGAEWQPRKVFPQGLHVPRRARAPPDGALLCACSAWFLPSQLRSLALQLFQLLNGTKPWAQGVTTGWGSLDPYYKVVPGELTIVTGWERGGCGGGRCSRWEVLCCQARSPNP